MMKEDIREGQRIEAFALDVWDGKDWKEIAQGKTVGWKKLLRFPVVESSKVRVRVLKARGSLSPFSVPGRFGLFFDPGR
jgi:alpha-L-fucosidase